MVIQRFRSFIFFALFALLAALLYGCAAPQNYSSSKNESQISIQPQLWRGRLALQTFLEPSSVADGKPEHTLSARFTLEGTPQQGQLELFSPLGAQLVHLEWTPRGAHLRTSSEADTVEYSDSLQDLVRQVLGIELPLEAMFDWLSGAKNTQNTKNTNLDSQGWEVDLQRYEQGRIRAKRSSYTEPALIELRIALDR